MPNSTTPVAASTRNEIDLEFEKQVMGFVSEAPKILQQNLAQDLSPNNQANSEFLRADNFLSQQTQIEQNGVVTMNGAEFAEKSSVIYDSTVRQVNDSVKKLVDAKNVISGISNFSQSPAFSELAINLMEPKLEKWLNQNLPDLVEKIVREEIKKMIPKD
jgi:cell pole-organizing protein PopZ